MVQLSFTEIDTCNMCGNRSAKNKVLGLRLNGSLKEKKKDGISITVLKCNKCGYVYSNPQPIDINALEKYKNTSTQNYWKTESVIPDSNHYYVELNALKKLKGNNLKNLKILDIGFGLGRTLHKLHEQGMEVWGIEPFESFYENAKNNNQLNFDRNKIQCSTFEDASFEKNQFDLLIFEAFQHVVDSDYALQKTMQWLKPGGLIQIEVANANWFIAKLINLFYKLKGSNNITNLSPLHAPYNQHEFTVESFEANAKTNKYSIAHIDYYVCDPYLPSFLGKIATWYMKKTKTGMQFSIWLKKN